jgi:3-deoxy-7-phosphoheptulonate synthase
MIVVMQEQAAEEQIQTVIDRLTQIGFDVHRSTGTSHTVLGAVGGAAIDPRDIELLEGVREVVKISASYKLASRAFKPDGTIV